MPEQPTNIALLRGVNVGGRTTVQMKRLKAICESLGWRNVSTLLNSGNVIFTGTGTRDALEHQLEAALLREFGLNIAVIIRSGAELFASMHHAPFEEERQNDGAKVLACFSKRAVIPNPEEFLRAYSQHGEIAAVTSGVLWIHFPEGMGRSKITPDIISKATGSPTIGRNWNTVSKLLQLVGT